MKNKILLSFFCLLGIGTSANAQHDTLQRFPFIYCYNCGETGVYHDSVLCTVMNLALDPPVPGPASPTLEFSVLQHSDNVLHAVGIAFGYDHSYGSYFNILSLYDSSLKKLREVIAPHVTQSWTTWYTDSSYQILTLPGKIAQYDFFNWCYDVTDMVLKYAFFDEPIDISGDFHIGLSQFLSYDTGNVFACLIPAIHEYHDSPYHFNSCNYSYRTQDTWRDTVGNGFIPELFLIIEPECHVAENISLTTDTAGCVSVEWDTLRWQRHWVLRLDGPDGTRYDTVDSNSYTYCGLNLNHYYELSIMTQCYRPGGHNWSVWSNPLSIGNAAIGEIWNSQVGIEIYPNPASRQVDITSEIPMTRIEAVDALGRLVHDSHQLSTYSHQLSTADWPRGTYLLRITTPVGQTTKKLLVQ